MQVAASFIIGDDGFFWTIESKASTLGSRTNLGYIIQTEHHVLRRNGDRSTIGWVQDVVALEHQNLSFKNSLITQRKVNGHLVTIKVGIEGGTSQWVQLNSLAFNQLRLESLDTQSVKCRGTVQKHRMTLHHILQDVPNDRLTTVDYLLGALHRLDDAAFDEFADDEGLVELGSHQLRQTTLSHLQFRSNDNYRTS